MSIPDVNASYTNFTGPTKTGQIVAIPSVSGQNAREICGTAEITLDGSLTAGNINWIDGTQVLGFTPTNVVVSRIPKSASGTEALSSIVLSVTTIDTTKFTLTLSAAGTNGHKLNVAFRAF